MISGFLNCLKDWTENEERLSSGRISNQLAGPQRRATRRRVTGLLSQRKVTALPKLICKKTKYFSQNDEAAFFEWIAKIKCVKKLNGVGDELHLYIPKKTVSDSCLRELLALFYRYKVNMKQLRIFLNDDNREWFMKETKYWYRGVFK